MLIDAHTHIFPADTHDRREELCRRDATFRELYSDPRARFAVVGELSAALDRNDTDAAIALGFAWTDHELCCWHNDALLTAGQADRRILPFCTINPAEDPMRVRGELERCAAAGARGVGELRPESLGINLAGEAGAVLARAAAELDLVLLFHTSEPVGHQYPGKSGGELSGLYRFIAAHPELRVICAHWGGGLPFYMLMPEVRRALANVWFDTAATTLLYEPAIYRRVIDLAGAERILFGSDFPLLGPRRQARAVAEAPLSEVERLGIMGENAARLFGFKGSRGAAASRGAG